MAPGEGLRLGRPALGVAPGEGPLVALLGAVGRLAAQLPVEHRRVTEGGEALRVLDPQEAQVVGLDGQVAQGVRDIGQVELDLGSSLIWWNWRPITMPQLHWMSQ